MPWFDFIPKKEYQRWVEKPRFQKATKPKESWLTKAFEQFRTGAELAERAQLEPEIPIVEREKPGPREELTREYRGIVERLRSGEIDDEHAEYLWNTAPETVFGNVSAVGLGAGPKLRDIRSFGDVKALGIEAITPLAPREMTEPLGRVPVVGRALEHEAAALTSPLGLGFAGKFPGLTGMMAAGGVAGATVGERIAGERGEMIGGLAGALAAPIAGPTAARVAMRGARAAPAAGRAGLAEAERMIPKARQVVMEELGGPKPRPMFEKELPQLRSELLKEQGQLETLVQQGRATAEDASRLKRIRSVMEQDAIGASESARFARATKLRRPGAPTREEALGKWRAGYEKPAAAPGAAREAVQPISEETARANTQRLQGVSGKPPAKPPTGPPEDPEGFIDWFFSAPASEKQIRTATRRYEGGISNQMRGLGVEIKAIREQATKDGIKLTRKPNEQMERLVEAADFPGPTAEAIRGLPPGEARLVESLHRTLRDPETAKMLRDVPGFTPREHYWPHQFAKGKAPGIGGRLTRRPGFTRKRKLEGTILEALEKRPDLDLQTWDVVDMMERRVYQGILYRQQVKLMENLKRVSLVKNASEVAGEPGWRTPRVAGRVFEQPKDPWVAPNDIAKALEDNFNPSMFSSSLPLRALREAVASAKYIKVFGGLFQQFDYTFRIFALAAKYRDPRFLGVAPKAWARGYFPGLDAKMTAWEMTSNDMRAQVRRALLDEGINVQAGLDFIGAEYEKLARDLLIYRIPVVGKLIKGFGSAAFRNSHAEYMLGGGTEITMNRMKGGVSMRQAAAQTAVDMNEIFSSKPAWQSVLRNPTTRDMMRLSIFSMAEQESWLTMPFRQRMFLANIMFTTAVMSNMVSLVTKGELLPPEAYKPFNVDLEKRSVDYNIGFLRAELPYVGPDGRKEYLDLLGQADTPFRFLGDPKFAIETRLGQFPAWGLQAYTGKTWFREEEITGPKELALFTAEQAAPIPAAPHWEERKRIGTVGAIIQSIGLNVSAERLGDLFRRRVKELTGEDWDKLDPPARKTTINEHPELLKLRAKQVEAGERYGGGWAQVDALDRDIEARLGEAIASGQVTGEQVRDEFKDYQAQRSWLSQQTAAEWGEPEGKTPAHTAALEYWAIEVPVRNGVKDWESFFNERAAIKEAHPELTDEWLRTNLAERFHEPQVRDLIYQILEADAVADEYFSIPYKSRMPAKQQEKVRDYVKQAESIASMQGISFRRALMQLGIPGADAGLALRYKNLPTNPARAAYWRKNPEKKELYYKFYRDIPLGIEEMAMAR